MSDGYPCPYCGTKSPTFADARQHISHECQRLRALGCDLEMKVLRREISIEDAEAEQARRPKLIL